MSSGDLLHLHGSPITPKSIVWTYPKTELWVRAESILKCKMAIGQHACTQHTTVYQQSGIACLGSLFVYTITGGLWVVPTELLFMWRTYMYLCVPWALLKIRMRSLMQACKCLSFRLPCDFLWSAAVIKLSHHGPTRKFQNILNK